MSTFASRAARVTGRRLALAGVIAGSVLLALSAVLFAVGVEPEFLAFITALVGGVTWGVVLGGLLIGDAGWAGVGRITLAAAILGALSWLLQTQFGPAVAGGPRWVGGVIIAVQFALIPAAGWLAMTAISALSQMARSPVNVREPVTWTHEARSSWLSFEAIPMTLGALALSIIVIVVCLGLAIAAILSLGGEPLLFVGPRFMITLLGVTAGLPAYIVLLAILRRRQVSVTAHLDETRLVLTVGADRHEIAYADITELCWGGAGESSRLVVSSRDGRTLSLVAGLAKVPAGRSAALPGLPRPVRTRLELAGLSDQNRSPVDDLRKPRRYRRVG